jgi:hypothetical protein
LLLGSVCSPAQEAPAGGSTAATPAATPGGGTPATTPAAPAATGSGGAAATPATTPSVPTSGDDYRGDTLVLQSNVQGFILLRDQNANPTKWLALRGTMLRVTQDHMVNGTRELLVSVVSTPCVVEEAKEEETKGDEKIKKEGTKTAEKHLKASNDFYHIGVGRLVDCPKDQDKIKLLVSLNEVYRVAKSELDQYGFSRSGWVYGALLVPYKYYFHDKSFSSATTIGPYLGYRMDGLGINTSAVASIGLSSLTVANPTGSGDTSTIQGFSFAIGFIGNVNKNDNPMTFGVLVGKDWAGSNSSVPYKHEGKTWAAIEIGFSFTK